MPKEVLIIFAVGWLRAIVVGLKRMLIFVQSFTQFYFD
ncbi:hypothetical protein TERMP_01369 [Thermococcus barophilus MP]|uniref:Uncharacterized protein n=1 Tax=Thermococcus barophilus (strain DSM 11836 / MP) TaxID=391623 RepID=F0LHU4_THEBM|nr:hypothetical protein TERMP_01369 [Thermococcus barophilus MP]